MDDRSRPRPRVIVGVDRSLHGLAAIRVAVAEAVRRGVPLYAVRVQSEMLIPLEDREIDDAFEEALGGLPPGLELHRELAAPPVVKALVSYVTSEEDLLVIGASRREGWRRLRPVPIAHRCVRRARCAVLAVPAPEMARAVRPRRGLWPHRTDELWEQLAGNSTSVRG